MKKKWEELKGWWRRRQIKEIEEELKSLAVLEDQGFPTFDEMDRTLIYVLEREQILKDKLKRLIHD